MRRSIVIATAIAMMVGVLGVTAAQAQPLTPRAPIAITANAGLNPANGVTNGAFPTCGLTAGNPCRIDHWFITPGPGGTCIQISNVTAYFAVDDNGCLGGRRGIALEHTLGFGTLANNNITGLLGSASDRDAVGIDVMSSSNLTITNNVLFNILGRPGIANGQDGGSAFGIRVLGVLPEVPSNNVAITGNRIILLVGEFGAPGGSRDSGDGGAGGSACGISANSTGTGILVSGNYISQLFGGFGGLGAFRTGGKAGDGGSGGDAIAICIQGYIGSQTLNNTINLLFPSFGGLGGSGGLATNGGKGGDGGDAYGIFLANVVLSTANNNTIFSFFGALAGIGGNAGLGGLGGHGGHGGDAVGINKLAAPTVVPMGNAINLFLAGLGGNGGFPLGVNGNPGITAPII